MNPTAKEIIRKTVYGPAFAYYFAKGLITNKK